jgi:LysR family hydrogen peroxide-inducible transcriptional activator
VASKQGITVLKKTATSDRFQNHLIKVIPFIKPIPSRTIAVAYRKSFVRMKALETISEAIRLIKTDTIEMI